MTRYNKSEIMKTAHRLYKLDKEHFPDSPYPFGVWLKLAWEDAPYEAYLDECYEVRQYTDFHACFDNPPVNH